jgi:TetR/AcrR family transcriptional repressor of mexAB-oprM operon
MFVRKERKDAAEHRRIILEKAHSLFTEFGVDGVTMHQIAKSAGIGQGTLYRRYSHKGEICLDLMQENSQHLIDEINKYIEFNKDQPIKDRLAEVLHNCIEFVVKYSPWLVSIQAPTCEGRQSLVYHSPLYKSLHSAICGLLEETSAKDPIIQADMILASLTPELFLFMQQDRGYSLEEIKQKLIAIHIDPLF